MGGVDAMKNDQSVERVFKCYLFKKVSSTPSLSDFPNYYGFLVRMFIS